MELERPCCYKEYCDSERSWEEQGIRIKWTFPPVPGESRVTMLEMLKLKDNPEGIYREVQLPYIASTRKWDDWGVTTYEFSTAIYPTHTYDYRLTFNVKIGKIMIWANVFQTDHILTVTPPKDISIWTQRACTVQMTNNMYLGNFVSVMLAEEMGFDAVLNLHQKTNSMTDTTTDIVKVFKSTDMATGAGDPISAEKIQEIVSWLQQANRQFNKILIGDHDGLGRVGSIMTAYIFANNSNLTFDEAYKFVKSRKFVYCHKGLKDILYQLYPRD